MYIVYNGALRGAGDTFVPAVAPSCSAGGSRWAAGTPSPGWRPDWGSSGRGRWRSVTALILGVFILARFKPRPVAGDPLGRGREAIRYSTRLRTPRPTAETEPVTHDT